VPPASLRSCWDDYRSNPITVANKYRGRLAEVGGNVLSITTDPRFPGQAVVALGAR
jgi:hypothetical protein